MRKWIAIFSVIFIVFIILIVILLSGQNISNDAPSNPANMADSKDRAEPDGNRKLSDEPADKAATNPVDKSMNSGTVLPPTPALSVQPLTATSLNLSVKNTEGMAIPSAAGAITQNNLPQQFTLKNDGTISLENLIPGMAKNSNSTSISV